MCSAGLEHSRMVKALWSEVRAWGPRARPRRRREVCCSRWGRGIDPGPIRFACCETT